MLVQLLINKASEIESFIGEDCCVLLLQEGVYAAHTLLSYSAINGRLYALKTDYLASGLPQAKGLKLIDFEDWVNLSITHHPVITLQ